MPARPPRSTAQMAKLAKRAAGGSAPPPRPTLPPPNGFPKWKAVVVSGGFAAVIFTGSIYGAGLKTKQEWKAEKQKVQEATAEEKISMLQQRRTQLVKQKFDLDIKLADLHARMTGVPRPKPDQDRPRARDLF